MMCTVCTAHRTHDFHFLWIAQESNGRDFENRQTSNNRLFAIVKCHLIAGNRSAVHAGWLGFVTSTESASQFVDK